MVDQVQPHGLPRYVVPVHWRGEPKDTNGDTITYEYGLGDCVLLASLLQTHTGGDGCVVHLPDQFKQSTMDYFVNMDTIYFFHYDSVVDGNPMQDATRVFRPGFVPMTSISFSNIISPGFEYCSTNKKTTAANEPAYDHVYCFDAKPVKAVNANNEQAWRNQNPNAVDVGGKQHSLANTIRMMQTCRKYVGALNGMAHLAMSCGADVTAYIPDDYKPDALQKMKMRALRQAGGKIKKESTMFNGDSVNDRAIDLPENI